MDELLGFEGYEVLIRTARNRMLVMLTVLLFTLLVSAVIIRSAPVDWRMFFLMGYVALPLFGLVLNALFYTDLRLRQFEMVPMCPVQDMIMEPWDPDDLVIEAVEDEDEE